MKGLILLSIYVALLHIGLCAYIKYEFKQTQHQIEISRQDSYCQFQDLSNQMACLDGNCDTWEIADSEGVNECRELFKEEEK